jgi:preprotein translocase subunit SecG
MYIAIVVLTIIVSVLLILIVLVQNPKGGGLNSSFGASGSQMMGVQRTSDFLEKVTWSLLTVLFVTSMASAMLINRNTTIGESVIQSHLENTTEITPMPADIPNNNDSEGE